MEAIRFRVPAIPVAQPRQRTRAFRSKTGKLCAQNYTPADAPVNAFKATVAQSAHDAYSGPPLSGPLVVTLTCVFPRPETLRWKNKPMPRVWAPKKPDCDNIAKSTLDSLSGLLFADDKQVTDLRVRKLYASGDEQACVEVEVSPCR